MSLLPSILIIAFCILMHAFFAGSEMGFVSVNRLRLRHLVDSGNKSAILISSLLEKPEKLFGTILVGTNISVIVATTIFTLLVRQYLVSTERLIPIIATAIMFPLFMIFGEIIPKTISRKHAARLVPLFVRPLKAIYWILMPVVFSATRISNLAALVLNRIKQHRNPFVTREELKMLVKEGLRDEEGDTAGKQMIYRIFDLEQTCANEVMVPLVDVVAIEENAAITDAIELMQKSGFSRLPVYRDRVDHIKGILRASDLIGAADSRCKLIDFVRPPYIVPETKPIDDILREMQQNQKHMAIVIDEYGGVSGVLTNEDIIEEIVGEIEDEYDRPLQPQITENGGIIILNAKMRVQEFEGKYSTKLPETDSETLAGMLMDITRRIPAKGDIITVGDWEFEIVNATDRKISKIAIKGLTNRPETDTNR